MHVRLVPALALACALNGTAAIGPAAWRTAPPAGIPITEMDRTALARGTAELAVEIGALRARAGSDERIRELLARAPAESVLVGLDRQPDYKITVEERRFLKDILESLDVKTGPSPPGGLYAHEIQQQVWNTRNSPLARPYAAFTSGELAQVTMTSILGKLVANDLSHAVLNLSRTEAENLAREEVRRAIEEYCSGRPDRSFIDICTSPTSR